MGWDWPQIFSVVFGTAIVPLLGAVGSGVAIWLGIQNYRRLNRQDKINLSVRPSLRTIQATTEGRSYEHKFLEVEIVNTGFRKAYIAEIGFLRRAGSKREHPVADWSSLAKFPIALEPGQPVRLESLPWGWVELLTRGAFAMYARTSTDETFEGRSDEWDELSRIYESQPKKADGTIDWGKDFEELKAKAEAEHRKEPWKGRLSMWAIVPERLKEIPPEKPAVENQNGT